MSDEGSGLVCEQCMTHGLYWADGDLLCRNPENKVNNE
jgi:hypothetical protein